MVVAQQQNERKETKETRRSQVLSPARTKCLEMTTSSIMTLSILIKSNTRHKETLGTEIKIPHDIYKYDTQHNDTLHKDTLHKDTLHNDTQHNGTLHKDT